MTDARHSSTWYRASASEEHGSCDGSVHRVGTDHRTQDVEVGIQLDGYGTAPGRVATSKPSTAASDVVSRKGAYAAAPAHYESTGSQAKGV